ncbi:MAG: DUF3108 domain-containing protein [Elusimicrobia bacterium]|nr:DUF3108 domain-containing protein [Elusimicrobiota bacterium]
MRRGLLCGAVFLAAACAVHRRATDPAPVGSAVAASEPLPLLVDQSTASVEAAPAVPPEPATPSDARISPPPKQGPAAKPRVWGRIAVSTSVVSPAQLIGPEVPYIPSYKALPVFPEKLRFSMSWGLLSVGETTMSVDKIVMFNGRPAYHLVSEARSNSFCDTFYEVRDLNESWLDARTLTSLGYSKKLREGHFYRDEWVLYDRDAGTFVARRTNRDGTFAVRTGTIPAQVHDILSSIYFTRAQILLDGSEVIVDVNTPDNWPLVIKVMERGTTKVPAGKFPSVLVEPMMRREGLFVQKGKRLRLWMSDDAYKRPLLMKAEVFFGHVTAALREML